MNSQPPKDDEQPPLSPAAARHPAYVIGQKLAQARQMWIQTGESRSAWLERTTQWVVMGVVGLACAVFGSASKSGKPPSLKGSQPKTPWLQPAVGRAVHDQKQRWMEEQKREDAERKQEWLLPAPRRPRPPSGW